MEELETKSGITAFLYYKVWFKKRNLFEPKISSFISSRYYNSFFKFVLFVNKVGIPDPTLYIEIMSSENILPSHWYNEDIYNFFKSRYDDDISPKTHVRITLTIMSKLSRILNCEINEIFNHIEPIDLARLIETKNISPWVLLFSPKFKHFFANKLNNEEKKIIEQTININLWKLIIEKNRKYIPEIKKYIEDIQL
jgi:hypothetical protein